MITLIQCQQLSHCVSTRPLFSDLQFTISSTDKIGLVGYNGCGKSTLFSLLNLRTEPDEGEVAHGSQLRLETVEQFISPALLTMTLAEAVADKLPEEEKSWRDYQVGQILTELAFEPDQFDFRVSDLSGGQQNRLMFARAMINEPNLILFDEPTNHLDLATILLFEQYLQNFNGAFVLISHDRAFLDAVTNRTLFLRDQTIHSFDLPYSLARAALEARDEADAQRLAVEEKTISRLKVSQKRIDSWARAHESEKLARKAKSMEKRIEKLEADKTQVTQGSQWQLNLEVRSSRANRLLQIENQVIHSPGAQPVPLFSIDDFFIRPGERVALLGHNGTGKTSLISQIISGYAGQHQTVIFNPQCKIGYYDQELGQLPGNATIIGAVRSACPGKEDDYRNALIKTGFAWQEFDKPVSVLSGGEKARLMFLIIRMNQPNFLILDEPTNHIDIYGKEALEEELLSSGATLLLTSHDRAFMDAVAQRYVLIHNGKLQEIDDPAQFYNLERPAPASNVAAQQIEPNPNPAASVTSTSSDSGEEILQRILTL
ncbi:MAG: ABC-F family ATP-binding cassette domain-containing protein, partial [Pseudomonadales bacterium]|nr:ABC-F family ATP-binding cassette domain-containing protein [Pseudomonadales bacterium]